MTSVAVSGLAFGSSDVADSDGVLWLYSAIKGWHDGPATKNLSADRQWAHGAFPTRTFRDARLITVRGSVHAPTRALASRAQALLASVLADGTYGDFTITDPDQGALTASVRLEGEPLVDWHLPCDIDYQLTFYAPDPLRYADPLTATTAFPTPGGGLRFPLGTDGTTGVGHLDFGLPGTSGRVTLTNPGTAEARPQIAVLGPIPVEGFDVVCVETGERLTFQDAVSAGSTLVMDAATGRVLLNGDADRSGVLTTADWFGIPPGATRTIAFLARGVTSAATMTVTIRPPWW